jgi:hypothetical protein
VTYGDKAKDLSNLFKANEEVFIQTSVGGIKVEPVSYEIK